MDDSIRVQLVDDHEIVRAGFRYLLEGEGKMQVVAESSSGRKACLDYKSSQPDIVIMDISLPDFSGLEVMRRILAKDPQAQVVILSMHGGMIAARAMEMGARGFVCKSSAARTLLTAIRQVRQGQLYLDAGLNLPATETLQPEKMTLTKRELEICLLLTEGHSVQEIADTLFISCKTVYTHREHIMAKTGVKSTIELAQVAARMGISFTNLKT